MEWNRRATRTLSVTYWAVSWLGRSGLDLGLYWPEIFYLCGPPMESHYFSNAASQHSLLAHNFNKFPRVGKGDQLQSCSIPFMIEELHIPYMEHTSQKYIL